MAEKEEVYFEIKLRIYDKTIIDRINKICQLKNTNKNFVIRELISKGLPIYEEELKTDKEKISDLQKIESVLKNIQEQNRIILDRQLTSRIYDKTIEKISNTILQIVIYQIPFITNGSLILDETQVNALVNMTRPEIAKYKNDLILQLNEGNNLLDKNERNLK